MTERLSDERVRTYVMWGTDPDCDMDRHVASLAQEVQSARKLRADLLADRAGLHFTYWCSAGHSVTSRRSSIIPDDADTAPCMAMFNIPGSTAPVMCAGTLGEPSVDWVQIVRLIQEADDE